MKERYYAAYVNSEDQLKESSSGGMAYAIAEHILSSWGGVVYGVRFSLDYRYATYDCIDKKEGLNVLNGTKYITTRKTVNDVGLFRDVQNALIKNKYVLFIGTPCDVGILIKYLKIEQCSNLDKLITLDFICHGPTQSAIQKEYVEFLEEKYHSRIVDFSVRYKNPYWTPIYLKAVFSNGKKHIKTLYSTDFGIAFSILGLEQCYDCKYKGKSHCSDITIGDFWGLNTNDNGYNRYGTSVVIIHTDKGNKIITELSDVTLTEYDSEKAIGRNPMYCESRKRDRRFDKFRDIHRTKGLHSAVFKTRNFKSKLLYLAKLILHQRPY